MEYSLVKLTEYTDIAKEFCITNLEYIITGVLLAGAVIFVIHCLRKVFQRKTEIVEPTVTADTIKNNTVNNTYNFN